MAERLNKRQWVEIAAISFILALIAWLLHNAAAQPAQAAYTTNPTELPVTSDSGSVPSLSPIGLPPITLPPYMASSGGGGGCGCSQPVACNGCAAGSTSNPTISAIVAIGNAALAQMQQASDATYAAIAAAGNEQNLGVTWNVG